MAIANSDGSIILSTKVDTSGMEQGTKSLKSQAAKLAAEYRKAGMSQSEAFKKAWSEIERTRKETEKATKSTQNYGEKAKTAFQGVGSALKSLAGYLALAFSVTKIIQFSNEAGQLVTQTEASVQRLVDIYGSASDSVGDFIDANARALGMSKSAAASFSSVYGNLFSVWADQATNAELTNRYLNMTAVVASKTGRTVEDVQERVRSGLLGNTEAIEDLGIFVNVKTIEMTDAFQRMASGKSWEQLDAYTQQQIRSMAILEQATAKYGDEVADTSATIRNRFNAAYQDFQNSWGNIVNTVLLPVLETLTQIFDIATRGLNALSGRSGQILENVELQEENTDKTAENIEEQTKNQKELNKELKKATASFDDIEILSANTADNTGGGGGDLGDLGLAGASPDGSAYVEEINVTLAAIMQVVGISLIAIGIMLLFLGQIGWGIGFIVGGAFIYSISERALGEAPDTESMKTTLTEIEKIVGGVMIAIGIILLFFGQIGWALGFIIGGAVIYSVAEAEAGSTDADQTAIERIQAVAGTAAKAFIAIGLLLLFLGQVPWGIGFIAAGAGLESISQVNLTANSQDIKDSCDAILSFLSGLVAYLIAQQLLIHWQTFVSLWGNFRALLSLIHTEGFLKTITTLFGASLSSIQLWAIAIGVIVAGIAYLALNWDKLSPAQQTITILTALAAAATAAAVAIALFHTSWSVGIAAATIAAGVALLAGTVLFKSYNGKKDLSGSGIAPASIDEYAYLAQGGTYKLPALAKGTVVPPNREFMAILGDNTKEHEIVSPVSTMKQAFMEAMIEMGGNFGGGNTEVVLEIDGREFGRAVVEQGNRENRRIGTRLVIA